MYRDFPVGNKLCKVPPLQTLFPTRKSLYKYAFLCFFLKKNFFNKYYLLYLLLFNFFYILTYKSNFYREIFVENKLCKVPPLQALFPTGISLYKYAFLCFLAKNIIGKSRIRTYVGKSNRFTIYRF